MACRRDSANADHIRAKRSLWLRIVLTIPAFFAIVVLQNRDKGLSNQQLVIEQVARSFPVLKVLRTENKALFISEVQEVLIMKIIYRIGFLVLAQVNPPSRDTAHLARTTG